MESEIKQMESELKKHQKRLGPAPIASFEKSFEESTSPGATAVTTSAPIMTIATSYCDDLENMDTKNEEGGSGHSAGGDDNNEHYLNDRKILSSPIIKQSSTSKKKLNEAGIKPPPLSQPSLNVSVQSVQLKHQISTGATVTTLTTTLGLNTPLTPRIDISRASSSSHHEDSRDSSPENVFEQVGTGTLQESIGLGFREEGAFELRSSTEELYFMDPEQKKEEQEKLQQARKSPVIFKFDEHQTYLQQHQRKDSASSEVAALLCISGRTSRISSVGSQGSGVSRLSAMSGISRSPSPHRMLLETSFCGPKPLENVVDGSIVSTVEGPTAEALEQILLSRKHDPTQAVFAEGIQIESSPKKKLTNAENKRKLSDNKLPDVKITKPVSSTTASRTAVTKKGGVGPSSLAKHDTGKHVIGVTPGGTEYIRIKLKPDHMYEDRGLAANERVIDTPGDHVGEPHKKPVSLSLGCDITSNASEQRLTPNSSPKPARYTALAREVGGSRSPSPATVAVSRKSSFCSLFKTKDSPDSPRDRSRPRSKSRDRSTPQSQSGTPNKQKSVLAIFKPKRSGSKSKCSSPIDPDTISQLDGISQVEFKFKSDPPSSSSQNEPRSRPSSRLRYYDTPSDGKSIHIPLHTPPEEKQDRTFLPGCETKEHEPLPPLPPQAKSPSEKSWIVQAPALPLKSPKPQQIEKALKVESLNTIHTINENLGSHNVQQHNFQETLGIDNSITQILNLSSTNVIESPLIENGIIPALNQTNIIQQHINTGPPNHHGLTTKEKRRLLFATRIGSGSEEQIFSTQFSLSKTESLSSQLSEQTSIPDSPAIDGRDPLHRSDTVLRRPDDISIPTSTTVCHRKRETSSEDTRSTGDSKPTVVGVVQKKDSFEETKRKSKSTSEDEDKRPVIVMMRKKDSSEDSKRKSKSASEEDDSTNRHSRYIENFVVRKKFHDSRNSRNSSDTSIKEPDSCTSSREDQDANTPVNVPQIIDGKIVIKRHELALPPPPMKERQSVTSTTDDLGESSESERDSERDSIRLKRHIPRHIGTIEDNESTGLVSQDSFEDELPYVPTTLPEERAHGVSLIPMKERVHMELKTFPVDRPRSTTPMNPASLEEYCGIITPDDSDNILVRGEKLRISLPRKDSTKDRTQKTKSPHRISNASGKSWFEFAENAIRGTAITTPTQVDMERRQSLNQDEESPPPLPPRKPSSGTTSSTGQWINFENIPEKRKPPKRITALPKDSPQETLLSKGMLPPVQYNYVKPEECQCECHEVERESLKSITSVDLLQGEDMQPLIEPESQEGIDPSDSSLDYSYGTEICNTTEQKSFEIDLSLGQHGSNRASLHSQDPDSPDKLSSAGTKSKQKSSLSKYRNP